MNLATMADDRRYPVRRDRRDTPPDSDRPVVPALRRKREMLAPEEYGELLARFVDLERRLAKNDQRTQLELSDISGRLKSIEDERVKSATRRAGIALSIVLAVLVPTVTALISAGRTIESVEQSRAEVQQMRMSLQESARDEARHSEAIRQLERQLEKVRP